VRSAALPAALALCIALTPHTTRAQFAEESPRLQVVRLDPRFDELIAPGAVADKIVAGHVWLEGPTWDPVWRALVFSDVVKNRLWRWSPGHGTDLMLEPSGYSGAAPFAGNEPGSNGTALDARGRLVVCEHGNRRVVRLERDGTRHVLADRYRGRRLNSPNDVVRAADGALWFTDPPFGLPRGFEDPAKELPFQGVYRLRGDSLELVIRDLPAPNGVGLSPDQRTLYVSNAERARPVWMAYPIGDDGSAGTGRELADARDAVAQHAGVPDGLEIDERGNLWAAGPGGLFVFAPDGSRLGALITGIATSNASFGGPAGTTLFVTASSSIWRIETRVRGAQPVTRRRRAHLPVRNAQRVRALGGRDGPDSQRAERTATKETP
jgi:gluconolactonase